MASVPLAEIKKDDGDEVQAVIDGTRVYVCGGKGLTGVSLLSGRRIFEFPWPEKVTKILNGEESNEEDALKKTAPTYTERGIVHAPVAKAAVSIRRSTYPSRSYPGYYQPPVQRVQWVLPMRVGITENRLFLGVGNRVLSLRGSEGGEGAR